MKKNLLMVLALMLVMMGCSDNGDATGGAQDTDDEVVTGTGTWVN